MSSVSIFFVYVTTSTHQEAHRIASAVVKDRLAACANILGSIDSIFEWAGEIKNERETVLVLKTSAERMPDLTARVKELHSYECPCIVAWPIEQGYPGFLNWVASETQKTN